MQLALLIGTVTIFAEVVPAQCEVYFSPKDRVAGRLIEYIDREQKSIKVAVYALTHQEITSALIRAKERGVQIEVMVDPFAVRTRSSVQKLRKAGVPLFVWDYELRDSVRSTKKGRSKPLMHDKFCVFGDRMVWTGSFNFTHDAAAQHQENVVALESKEIASKYLQEFAEMKLYETRPYDEYLALHPNKGKQSKKGV